MISIVENGVRKSIANLRDATGIELQFSDFQGLGPRTGPTEPWSIAQMPDILEVHGWQRIVRTLYENGQHVGIHNSLWDTPLDGLLLSDLWVRGSLKWDSRSYGMRAKNVIQHCAFQGPEREHNAYWNTEDDEGTEPCSEVRYTYFEDAGGQNVQWGEREYEQGLVLPADRLWLESDKRRSRPLVVESCLSRNAGSNLEWGRASFAFSFPGVKRADGTFRRSHKVVAINRLFVDKWEQDHARGCLLIGPRPRAHLGYSTLLGGLLEQPLAKVEGEGEVLIVEKSILHGRGGQSWIDISPGWEKVWIAGCKGNAHVHRDKKDLGPASEVQGWL